MKMLNYPYINPRIDAGASLGYSALDQLSFMTGLACADIYDRARNRRERQRWN